MTLVDGNDLDQVELPEADTTSPIEDPELAAMAEELATRSRAREAAAEARQERVAEAQADQAQGAALREAAGRDAEVRSPEAWSRGRARRPRRALNNPVRDQGAGR